MATVGLVAASLIIGTILAMIGLEQAQKQTVIATNEKLNAQRSAVAEQAANRLTQKRLVQLENGIDTLMTIFRDLNIREILSGSKPLEAVLASRLQDAGKNLQGDALGDPLRVAALQHQLGVTLLNLGFPADARGLLEEARATRTSQLGPESPEALASRGLSAMADLEAGNVLKAVPELESVLQRWRATLGENDLDTLEAANNFGAGLRKAGRSREAIPVFEDVLKRRREHYTEAKVPILSVQNNLGMCYLDLLETQRAKPILEETLKETRQLLGDDHMLTQGSASNLAAVYLELKQFDKAVPQLELILTNRKARHGEDHPDTMVAMNNLAAAYMRMDNMGRALPLLKESLRLNRLKLGPEHNTTLATLNNLASAYGKLRQFDEAFPLFEELVRLREKSLTRQHPDTRLAIANLGITYHNAKRHDEAIRLLEEVHSASRTESALGWTSKHLLYAYSRAGREKEARELTIELVDRARKELRPESLALASALDDYAYQLMRIGINDEAAKLLKESLALRRIRQPESWDRFGTQGDYGAALVGLKRFDEAEPLLLEAYEGLTKHRDSVSTPWNRLRETADALVRIYQARMMPDKVSEWQAKSAGQRGN